MNFEDVSDEDEKARRKVWTKQEKKEYLKSLSEQLGEVNPPAKISFGFLDEDSSFTDLSSSGLQHLALDADPNFLTFLYLSNNQLEFIPEDLFLLYPSLTWLDVRFNLLTSIPESIENHSNLETLLLKGNQIEFLPIELGSIPNLKNLQVSENPLIFPSEKDLVLLSTEKNLIKYLKHCWKSKSVKVPIHSILKRTQKRFTRRILKPIKRRELSEIVCEKRISCNILDQIVAEKITNELRSQDKIIQKAKDKDNLKKWRDKRRYETLSELKIIQPPPYGVDENLKIPSRKDLIDEIMKKNPKRQKGTKKDMNLNDEIEKLRKSLESMNFKRNSDDPRCVMSSRLKDMKTIKEIQRKIAILKRLN